MEPHEIIITIAVIVSVVAMVAWGLTKGRQIKWPRGHRMQAREPGGPAVVVVMELGWPSLDLVVTCARAAAVTYSEWRTRFGPKHEVADVFCVWIREDADYERDPKWSEWLKRTASFLSQVPRAIGAGPPMAVIRASLVPHLERTGQPFIHEVLHDLAGRNLDPGMDRQHQHPDVWEHGGPESVETRATKAAVA